MAVDDVTDLLADWWRHSVTIKPYLGESPIDGPIFGDTYTELCMIDDSTKLVADGDGNQVASSARLGYSINSPYVPVRSEATLPAAFGGRTTTVIVARRGDGGGQPTPDHHELALL